MSTVLTDTNVSELLKVSAGQMEILTRLTDDFKTQVQEQFRSTEPEPAKPAADQFETPAAASANP